MVDYEPPTPLFHKGKKTIRLPQPSLFLSFDGPYPLWLLVFNRHSAWTRTTASTSGCQRCLAQPPSFLLVVAWCRCSSCSEYVSMLEISWVMDSYLEYSATYSSSLCTVKATRVSKLAHLCEYICDSRCIFFTWLPMDALQTSFQVYSFSVSEKFCAVLRLTRSCAIRTTEVHM